MLIDSDSNISRIAIRNYIVSSANGRTSKRSSSLDLRTMERNQEKGILLTFVQDVLSQVSTCQRIGRMTQRSGNIIARSVATDVFHKSIKSHSAKRPMFG